VIDYPLAERSSLTPFGPTEEDRMNKALLLGCVAVLTLGMATDAIAQESLSQKWEYKAVSFNVETAEATKILNDLNKDGWEYVGPLANGLVAFKRAAPSAADGAIKKEIERMQGTWTTVSTEVDGQQRAEEKKSERLTFTNNKWLLKIDGEISQEGTYKIVEAGAKFVKVDFFVTGGFKQGDTWISIMQIEGDKMKWTGCYVTENKARPKMLSTREGDGYFLRTLKHDK
jgi:uncharacterized protein (TIGR03067 family)